ncbi:unnamed protein product [Cladocopium goreaui]|uniref:Serine-threonine kinase receptor-associated protein n=1 Tax=Cladocopium goreaui TaxID=2562237 RepID=A0A9P1CNX9_9DINO|nr:unnamed protein product [Cladocopium goreaui]
MTDETLQKNMPLLEAAIAKRPKMQTSAVKGFLKNLAQRQPPDTGSAAKPKEMWQPRRNGEPLVLKKQDETDGGPAERVAASASRSARDGRDQGPTLHGHERPVTFLTFNSESNLLFSCGKDKIVCVWSFPDGELLGSYKGHNGAVWSCSATFDSRWLVTCGADRLVIVWEARTSRELARVELPGVVRCVEWAGAGAIQKLRILDLITVALDSMDVELKLDEDFSE